LKVSISILFCLEIVLLFSWRILKVRHDIYDSADNFYHHFTDFLLQIKGSMAIPKGFSAKIFGSDEG